MLVKKNVVEESVVWHCFVCERAGAGAGAGAAAAAVATSGASALRLTSTFDPSAVPCASIGSESESGSSS